ncbi:MAG TPA: acetyl-CoA carboxylase biotin carboxylase subunit [Deltaproteobacteria bacterium]|nr:acetyl-CoA carboxylase biotin carboxylase subunit [Deltaproteobacteria bacterium]HQI02489.1 acetyl-CoA carboxylase biotin carboxylase subunit [Deltaproteobacteria bacterium]
MFRKILVANRGEIARRIMSTCREMGIASVGVYSEADRKAVHVLKADQTVFLGGSEPGESYLNIDKIIASARQTGAEAVHPGYGFLAENSNFARRCEEEGIVFIGPPSHVIAELGDKTIARRTVRGSGVPVIPGMDRPESDPEILAREAAEIGYPVLIKAAAGGGGKGMRVVASPGDFQDACTSASSEAKRAFGNGSIYLEKYLSKPRHVEFQIMADTHGNVIHLFERECSIQRRHQKIIEETPSPAMTPELRERMAAAAIAVAKASAYVNAGTVEFLVDQEGSFYFLEVNTRLQVEHPVTEMITGLDIVRLQLEVAAGNPLPLVQEDIASRGHAIECRIYAEDPERDFYPSPGTVVHMEEPSGPGIRNDCGIYSGFQVPVEYDPILSKLIVHAGSREQAITKMIRALEDYVILGVKTPVPFLLDVLNSEPFGKGDTFTDFIDTHFAGWKPDRSHADAACAAYIIDELSRTRKGKSVVGQESVASSPWQTLGLWGR